MKQKIGSKDPEAPHRTWDESLFHGPLDGDAHGPAGRRVPERSFSGDESACRELFDSLVREVEEKSHDLIKKNEELKMSEERYYKMIEEVEDYAIILLDENGIILNWNKGAEKINGYSEEEVLGKSFETFYSPRDREKRKPGQLIREARERGKAVTEGWRMRKDGKRFWGSVVLTALHDARHRIIGFSKVTRDLTDKKLAEDKLRRYSRKLEFQNRELEEFAYATSHDMKEPLRKIHLYNSYVLDSPSNQLDSKSREFLNRSVKAVKRMSGLIEDLLLYSKATSQLESFCKVDLDKVLEDILSHRRDEIEQRRIVVELDKLPVINAIPFQCKQLFDNLIGNSVKYQYPGRTGRIEIRSETVKEGDLLGENSEARRSYYKISIRDNGIGFEQEYAEKIFEIFQRLHHLPGITGSGIGLAICKKIMQNHNGFITAEGKLNEGSCFTLYFPVRR